MRKVLISDDEPLVVSALSRQARLQGLAPIAETASEKVHALAKTHRPNLIILDINQNPDGRDILAKLKKDPDTKDLKVLILTAREDQFDRHVCFELGAVDYEVKPFDGVFVQKMKRLAETD